MYSTKSRTVDRLIDIKGEREKRWITIGNPYKDVREAIPSRWKKKQFECIRHPKNAGGGYFGYNGKAFTYAPQKFQEVPAFLEAFNSPWKFETTEHLKTFRMFRKSREPLVPASLGGHAQC